MENYNFKYHLLNNIYNKNKNYHKIIKKYNYKKRATIQNCLAILIILVISMIGINNSYSKKNINLNYDNKKNINYQVNNNINYSIINNNILIKINNIEKNNNYLKIYFTIIFPDNIKIDFEKLSYDVLINSQSFSASKIDTTNFLNKNQKALLRTINNYLSTKPTINTLGYDIDRTNQLITIKLDDNSINLNEVINIRIFNLKYNIDNTFEKINDISNLEWSFFY